MGFWQGFAKVLQGKPVFEVPTDAVQKDIDPRSVETQPTSTAKTIPTVLIERTDYHNNGPQTRVSVYIKNQSSQRVELDKIRLLGTSTELDTYLDAGQSREFNVFQGNRPNNRNYDDAFLVYKDATGDYFETHHTVEFKQEVDNTYSVVQFRYVGQVKDI